MIASAFVWVLLVGTPDRRLHTFGYRTEAACRAALSQAPKLRKPAVPFEPECVRTPLYAQAGRPIT